jgi:hypothetical protein
MSMKVSGARAARIPEKTACAVSFTRRRAGQKIIDTGVPLIYDARAFETEFLNRIAPTLHSGGPPAAFTNRPVTRR